MAEYVPLIIDRAQGCFVADIEGREYLDATSSIWCNVHGHRHPRINKAIRDQLELVAHTTTLGASNPTTIRLARALVEIAPPGLNHVFFSDDGSTAVEVALKMAFQYWQQCPHPRPEKTCYLSLGEAYHGDTLGAVSVGGVERFHAMFGPLLFPVIRLPSPDCYRTPPGVSPENLTTHYLAELEKVLAENHDRIAAMVIEPLVQAAAGIIVHPPGYLAGVRELTRKYNVLLIADEVAVGFGRTAKMFACEHEDVSPDFLCVAKGITGGYLPLAATLTTDEVWNAFLGEYAESKTFFHGHTYAGNPTAAAAALASLDLFEEERTLERMPEKCQCLSELLATIAKRPHVGDVRQRGLMAGIELVSDRASKTPYPWVEKRGLRVCEFARHDGVLLRPLGNVVVIMPPLTISLRQLEAIAGAINRGIASVTES